MSDGIVQLLDVTKTYSGKTGPATAVDHVSFTVQAGEAFGLVGQSGSGKSTLLRIIHGLEHPTSGTVRVRGSDVASLRGRASRRYRGSIGMIFQHFNLLANSTVQDNIVTALQLAKRNGTTGTETLTGRMMRDRAHEALEFVNLAAHAKKYPAALSGGEQQRVGIARALAAEPDILLCDEPTSALDGTHADEVLATIRRAQTELGTTVVFVSHDLEAVRAVCSRAAVLDRGRIVAETAVAPAAAAAEYASYAQRAAARLRGERADGAHADRTSKHDPRAASGRSAGTPSAGVHRQDGGAWTS